MTLRKITLQAAACLPLVLTVMSPSGAAAESFVLPPAGCPMAHCDARMSDDTGTRAPLRADFTRVVARPGGAGAGLGCVSSLDLVACTFRSDASQPSNLVVMDGAGNRLWDDGGRLRDSAWMSVPILGADGTLIAADRDTVLRADPRGQRILWQSAKVDGGLPVSPVLVGSDASMVFVATAPADVPGSAAVSVWEVATGALLSSRPLVDAASGRVYVTRNTVAVRGNRAYVLANAEVDSADGRLFAVDVCESAACGGRGQWSVRWSYALAGPSGASPLLIGDTLYFDGRPARGGAVFHAVRDTGGGAQRLWTRSFASRIGASAVQDPRGGLWVHPINPSADILYRLDAATGATLQDVRPAALMGLGSGYSAASAQSIGRGDGPAVLLTTGMMRLDGGAGLPAQVAVFDVGSSATGSLLWRHVFVGEAKSNLAAGQFPVVRDPVSGGLRHVFAGSQSSVFFVGER